MTLVFLCETCKAVLFNACKTTTRVLQYVELFEPFNNWEYILLLRGIIFALRF